MEYWHENQRPQDRREFDLNDPDSKLKDVPARVRHFSLYFHLLPPQVSDNDPRMTVSGIQTFPGEDLQEEDRKSLQKEQMRFVILSAALKSCFIRDWLSQQIAEKKRLSMEQKKADKLHDLKSIEMDERAQELARADEMTRKTLNVAIKDYNQALVRLNGSLHIMYNVL